MLTFGRHKSYLIILNANNLNLGTLGGCIWPHRARASKWPNISSFNGLKHFFCQNVFLIFFQAHLKCIFNHLYFLIGQYAHVVKSYFELKSVLFFFVLFEKYVLLNVGKKKRFLRPNFVQTLQPPPPKKNHKKIQSNFTLENWTYMFLKGCQKNQRKLMFPSFFFSILNCLFPMIWNPVLESEAATLSRECHIQDARGRGLCSLSPYFLLFLYIYIPRCSESSFLIKSYLITIWNVFKSFLDNIKNPIFKYNSSLYGSIKKKSFLFLFSGYIIVFWMFVQYFGWFQYFLLIFLSWERGKNRFKSLKWKYWCFFLQAISSKLLWLFILLFKSTTKMANQINCSKQTTKRLADFPNNF